MAKSKPTNPSLNQGDRISAAGSAALSQRCGKTLGQRILENWQLYALLVIPVVLTVVYKYIPMYGIQIAFRNFDCQCRCDFVVFRRKENVGKWRLKVCSL